MLEDIPSPVLFFTQQVQVSGSGGSPLADSMVNKAEVANPPTLPSTQMSEPGDDRLKLNAVYCQPAAVASSAAQHTANAVPNASSAVQHLHAHRHSEQHLHPHRHQDAPAVSALSYAEQAAQLRETTDEEKSTRYAALSICKSLIAGGVAGGVSRSAVAPLERLKILLQVQTAQNAKYTGMLQGLRAIWRSEGLRGFFKGNGTNCARIVPNSAVKFFAYEEASNGILWLVRQQTGHEDAELTPLLRLGAGATAGIVAMSATYPLDMVRGRLTVQTENSPHHYKGMFHALTTVTREEGVRALYKGWLPSVIGVVPYVGLNFAVYETLKDWVVKAYAGQGATSDADLSVLTKLACGAAAGTTGQTVAYPLDVVRRRMQMVGWKDATHGGAAYSGMLDAFRQTLRREGVGALYKGLVPNSVKVVPSIAIAFVTYEVMKDLLGVEIRISD